MGSALGDAGAAGAAGTAGTARAAAAAGALVERFDRRGTETFELFRSEFGRNSVRINKFRKNLSEIQNFQFFNIFKNIRLEKIRPEGQ